MEPGELAESRVALKAYSWVPVFFQFLNPAMEELAQHFLRLLQCARRHPVMSSGLSLQTVADEIEVFRRRSDRKDQFESQCLNVNVTPPLSKQGVTRSWPKSCSGTARIV